MLPRFAFSAAILTTLLIIASSQLGLADNSPQVDEIRVVPDHVELRGANARRGILVEGRMADGRWIDLTHQASYLSSHPQRASVTPAGEILGRADGDCRIEVRAMGQTAQASINIRDSHREREVDFENDIIPIFNRHRCNSSGCHGKAEGQNGFKLSVFGFDPLSDHAALTQEGRGRRVFLAAPQRSLLLAKASGETPHGGGARIAPNSSAYRRLQEWIANGARFSDGSGPKLLRIELYPLVRVVDMRGKQQLRVMAIYDDDSRVDVTSETRYDSNHPGLVQVDENGLVTAGAAPGQAAVMASYMGRVNRFQILIPRRDSAFKSATALETHFLDRPVQAQLQKLRIGVSPIARDSEFLRRVYLDVIGALPTASEARRFLDSDDPQKRAKLVDALLERPEYADYWSLKWSDILRVDRRALGHKKAYAYYRWIHQQFTENRPFDSFARDLLTASGPLRDAPQGHFYSAVKGSGAQASAISQIFLGVRIACAECHHHPFDRWSQSDYLGMTAYFAAVKQANTSRGPALFANNTPAVRKHPRSGKSITAHPLGEVYGEEPVRGEVRGELADWMTSPQNPWFSRAAANRYWAHFLGRGIVEPVDDFRETNPPNNPELLDALASSFSDNGFDLKQLIRDITSSKTYQRTSKPQPSNLRDEQNYSRKLFKRLEAEVLLDAVSQVTGADEKFQGVPFGAKAVQLWDSETPHYFLSQFGRPQRKTACECERSVSPTVGQVLHLLNSPELSHKISHAGGRAARLTQQFTDNQPIIEDLYLSALSRRPTAIELEAAERHLNDASQSRRENVEDLMWALINTMEFVFNH